MKNMRGKHLYFRDKETARQTDSSARGFSPARKIHLFLGSLSSLRNHARSPPDDFLTRLPDFQRNCHGNKDTYIGREYAGFKLLSVKDWTLYISLKESP